jgi:hypothetical protein
VHIAPAHAAATLSVASSLQKHCSGYTALSIAAACAGTKRIVLVLFVNQACHRPACRRRPAQCMRRAPLFLRWLRWQIAAAICWSSAQHIVYDMSLHPFLLRSCAVLLALAALHSARPQLTDVRLRWRTRRATVCHTTINQ